MLGPHANERLDALLPVLARLLRQPHHQVEADVVEPGAARLAHRGHRPAGRVNAAQPFQLGFAERLDAKADAIDTGGAKPSIRSADDVSGLVSRVISASAPARSVAARSDQAGDLVGIQERRCAAAEEDGVGRRARARWSGGSPLQRLDVARLQRRLEEAAVEIAVIADGAAERDVKIEPEHRSGDSEPRRSGRADPGTVPSRASEPDAVALQLCRPPPTSLSWARHRRPLGLQLARRAWRGRAARAFLRLPLHHQIFGPAVGRQVAIVRTVVLEELAHLVQPRMNAEADALLERPACDRASSGVSS